MTKKFAIIGTAGYIARRHLKAIKDVGGNLLAALDISDSVGILDAYFPDCEFFKDEYAFYDFLIENPIDYLVVCSPNYLHEEHCYAGLKLNADVICEKPLTLTVESLNNLIEAENYTNKNIYTILQLRLHPMLQQLKNEILLTKKYEVEIIYNTPRGKWYHNSWKGDVQKSGGIATNIGIHLFDLVGWLFGDLISVDVEKNTSTNCIGSLELTFASVKFYLSIEQENEPRRLMVVDGKSYEFTDGFTELHTQAYQQILNQNGFTTSIVKPSIDIVEKIRKY